MITTLTLCLVFGFAFGRFGPKMDGQPRRIARIQAVLYAVMLMVLGGRLGIQLSTSGAWGDTLLRSIVLMAGGVLGSCAFVFPVRAWLEPESEEVIRAQTAHLPDIGGPIQIMGRAFAALAAGVVAGVLASGFVERPVLDRLGFALLCSIIVLIGIDSGGDEEAGEVLSSFKFRLALVPLLIALGSVAGSSLAGLAMGLYAHQGGAVGAGCGWYSLTTLLLGNLEGQRLASWGLLANLFREAIAILLIPLIARIDRGLLLLAVPGCTAMDTTLPMLGRLGGNRMGVMAFISGAVLSLLVPLLVPWSYRLLP